MGLPLSLQRPGVVASSQKRGGGVIPVNNKFVALTSSKIVIIDPVAGTQVHKPHSVPGANNMAFSPKYNRLVIASSVTLGSVGGMYYSDDMGDTWTKAPANVNWNANTGWLYAFYNPISKRFFGLSWRWQGGSLVVSDDGINWANISGGASVGEIIATFNSMDVDIVTGTLIVGLYANGGNSWYRSTTPLMDTFSRVPVSGSAGPAIAVLASMGGGKWCSYGSSFSGPGQANSVNDGVSFVGGTQAANQDAPQFTAQLGGRTFVAHVGGNFYSSPDPTSVAWTQVPGSASDTVCMVGDKTVSRTIHIASTGAVRILTDGTSWPAPIMTLTAPLGTVGRGCWIP